MADPGTQLELGVPPESSIRTLLPFPPATVGRRNPGQGRPVTRPQWPDPSRQDQRLAPRFQALQNALAADTTTLSSETATHDPELMVVFEVIDTIPAFIQAVRRVDGLEFITDFVGDESEADEDFYFTDNDGAASAKAVPQTMYLTMMNQDAVNETIRLFEQWKSNPDGPFPYGLAPLRDVFRQLKDVRRWGPKDRVNETGLYEQLLEEIELKGNSGNLRVEIELVWRSNDQRRSQAQQDLRDTLSTATIVSSCQLSSIRYHAVLAELPASHLQPILDDEPQRVEILCVSDVLFVSPSSAMSFVADLGDEEHQLGIDQTSPSGPPKVALLDGYPLANHDCLAGRLIVDDPNDIGNRYPLARRSHGTAMASLIIHGDLSEPGPSLATPLYVRPVMIPQDGLNSGECLPPDRLFVDIIHEAMQRLRGTNESVGQSVRIVNLSLGDPARMFIRHASPLARLLDHMAYEHNIVIIVSAGNHREIGPRVPSRVIDDPKELDRAVRKSLYEEGRNRRLLSPAEAVNIVTVGALHSDSADIKDLPDTVIDPLFNKSIATYSPTGAGFGRSPKPELHVPGGRLLYQRPISTELETVLQPVETAAMGPGLLVAGPSRQGGTSGTVYTRGTSNAAALTTRLAHSTLATLESLSSWDDVPEFPDPQYHPVLLKALLVHATMWPDKTEEWAEQLSITGRGRKRDLTNYLGFGVLNATRLATATSNRVTLIGAGTISHDERHQFGFPLPPYLSAKREWRRLLVTLAWLTPTAPMTRDYRRAVLTCQSSRGMLELGPTSSSVYHHMNGRGTVFHEILEGDEIVAFVEGDELSIDVACRVRTGRLEHGVRFGVAATLEVGPGLQVDIHSEIRELLRQRIRIPATGSTQG